MANLLLNTDAPTVRWLMLRQILSVSIMRFLLAAIACQALAVTVAASAQESSEELLAGKWRHTALVRVVDGNALVPQKFDGSTRLEFKSDNTWTLTSPYNRSAGTYRWLSSDFLETTTLESGLAIQVGTVSAKQVRVDGDRLNLITVQTQEEAAKFLPPPKPGVVRPKEVVVTSIFGREKGE